MPDGCIAYEAMTSPDVSTFHVREQARAIDVSGASMGGFGGPISACSPGQSWEVSAESVGA